jgi:hypothetical protein
LEPEVQSGSKGWRLRSSPGWPGNEAGATEIVGWTYEMTEWFALTQGRYQNVIDAVAAGQLADRGDSVSAQLAGQEAKSLARMDRLQEMYQALERGRSILSGLPYPERTDHHFVVDPDKWDFYAMDECRMAGDDEAAAEYA